MYEIQYCVTNIALRKTKTPKVNTYYNHVDKPKTIQSL